MKCNRLLLVDDDDDLSMVICDMLEDNGFVVDRASDGNEAFELLSKGNYHVLLLDINLPDTDGLELCREIRKHSDVPVIFASARVSEDDRIAGLETGGDDYLTKPFSLRELIARIRALIRRVYGVSGDESKISFGNVCVHPGSGTVEKNGKIIALSQREYDLLSFMLRNKNTVLTKERLISGVWGAFSEVEPSTLTVHIRWLREKLEDDPASPVYIKTVYRVGYILEVPDEIQAD